MSRFTRKWQPNGQRDNATRLLAAFMDAMKVLGEWADNPDGYEGEQGIELWLDTLPELKGVRDAMKTYALNERDIVVARKAPR